MLQRIANPSTRREKKQEESSKRARVGAVVTVDEPEPKNVVEPVEESFLSQIGLASRKDKRSWQTWIYSVFSIFADHQKVTSEWSMERLTFGEMIPRTGFTPRRCSHAKCRRQVCASKDFECTKRQLERVVGDAPNAFFHESVLQLTW